MKKKRIAAVAAAVLAVSLIAPAVSVGATSSSRQPNDAYTTDAGNSTDWATGSKSTTMLKKVLWLNDDTDIPDAEFKFTVTSGEAKDATYEDDTTGKKVKTLAVKAGVDPDKITYKEVKVKADSSAFDSDVGDKTLDSEKVTTSGSQSSTVTLTYVGQSKSIGETIGGYTDDNVVINDDVPKVGTTDQTSTDTSGYFAIKEVQLDFSKCVFKEPGVYRYIITEIKDGDTVPGVSYPNDNVRTLDVYVRHADGDGNTNKLTIAGYVMYVGEQKNGPQAAENSDSKQNDNKLEDKIATNNDGFNFGDDTTQNAYGVANGYEVAIDTDNFAQKSEGIVNSYSSHKLTFEKNVDGNQASKDKFFKFTLKIDGDTSGTKVSDTSVFRIDNSGCITAFGESDASNTATPNDATIYTIKEITANGSANYGNNPTYTAGSNTITAVTGAQLKSESGYSFYLQHGQKVTVMGLPDGVKYTLTECQEDYTPGVSLKASSAATETNPAETWDDREDGDLANGTVISTLTKTGSNTSDSQKASYTDTSLKADAYATFTNTRQGTVPTGVLISVAAPTFVGLGAAAGIIYLLTKKKKKDEE